MAVSHPCSSAAIRRARPSEKNVWCLNGMVNHLMSLCGFVGEHDAEKPCEEQMCIVCFGLSLELRVDVGKHSML